MNGAIDGGWALRTVIGDRKSITLTIKGLVGKKQNYLHTKDLK